MEVTIGKRILSTHDEITGKNVALLKAHGVLTVNMMGSPGAGKTAVLEKLIGELRDSVRMAVIEGDLFTSKDAQRIEAQGVPVVQINTRGACHLDGQMIAWALGQLNLAEIDLLMIENIGNLVCPAEFDLGEDLRVSLLSVTEGEDKVQKYPLMFTDVSATLLNKIDLLPYTNFKLDDFYHDIRLINPAVTIFEISCTRNQGIAAFAAWLQAKLKSAKNL